MISIDILSFFIITCNSNANEKFQKSSIRRLPSIPASQSVHNIKESDEVNQEQRSRSRSAGADQANDQPQSPTIQDSVALGISNKTDIVGDGARDESHQTVQKIRQGSPS